MQTFAARRYSRIQLFLFTFLIVLTGAVFAAALVFLVLPRDLGDGYGAVLSTVRFLEKALLGKVALIYAGMMVLIALAVVLLHLFYSHRIAGPAYRLGKEAAALGEGSLKGNIRFRQKDSLTDMADSVSQTAVRYRERVIAARDHLALIERQADSMAHLIQRGESAPALEPAVRDIRAQLKNLDSVLSEVRT